MTIKEFLAYTRWYLLILGLFFVILFPPLGIVFIIGSVVGFIVKRPKLENFEISSYFDYSVKAKNKDFIGCPVCKKGSIKKIETAALCDNCNSEFVKRDAQKYELITKKTISEFKSFKYSRQVFDIYQWNTIYLTGQTLRENTLDSIRKGKLPQFKEKNSSARNKEALIWSEESELHEPRAVRQYGGSSVRVAKGVRFHLGQAESHQEMRFIDEGTLRLTAKKIYFLSAHRTIKIDMNKVLDTILFSDGFRIYVDNRQRPYFFTVDDPDLWGAMLEGIVNKE
ncbi:MAG: hypothetical protein ACMXYF_03240 [Candidatus Woesearchaeota archaeon]